MDASLLKRTGKPSLSSKQGDLQVNILCDSRQIYLDEDRFEDEYEEEVEGGEENSNAKEEEHNLEKDDLEDGEDTEQPIMIRVEVINKQNQKLTFDANLGREHLAINALHATPASMDPPSDVPYLSGPTRNLATFTGPNFLDLSEDMQEAFTNYLHSVGVDATLYEALREHLTTKEHKEYVAWLNSLNSFIGK
jgi:Mitochondrial glycoprotein